MKLPKRVAEVDESAALKRVQHFEKEIDEVLALGDGPLILAGDEDYVRACNLLVDVKARQKVLAEEHRGFLTEVKKLVDRVNGWFKPAIEKHARAEARYKDAIRDYNVALESRVTGLKQAAKRTKNVDERDRLLFEADSISAPKVPGISFTPRIEIEVFDFEALPRGYKLLVADEASIANDVRNGEKIPGVRWKDARSVTVNTKNAGAVLE